MGNNSSHIQNPNQQKKGSATLRTSRRSSHPNEDPKPTLDYKECKPAIDVKAKPTASVSKVTSSNLFLDNIIDDGNHSGADKSKTEHDYAEGEIIQYTDPDTVAGDYFSYKKLLPQQELNNELCLPSNDNDDTLFDDDAIYTPGLDNQEFLREAATIKYTDPSLTTRDTVAIIGNFSNANTKTSNGRSSPSVSSAILYPHIIKLIPFLSESKVKYFHTDIVLPIGIYRCKFLINNKQTKISNEMAIATDKCGNVVNWFEVKPKSNQLYDYYNNSNPSRISVNLGNNNKSYSNPVIQNLKANNSTTSSFNLTLTKEKHQYSKEIPEIYVPFIPNLHSETPQPLAEIDPLFLEKHPLPELPIYLNNAYLNKQFNQQQNAGNHTPNGGHHPHGNSIMKGLNFHIIPHVNLNHLLTSNIKNNILTVACTTRYHGKFVTQIMYSPSEEAEE